MKKFFGAADKQSLLQRALELIKSLLHILRVQTSLHYIKAGKFFRNSILRPNLSLEK